MVGNNMISKVMSLLCFSAGDGFQGELCLISFNTTLIWQGICYFVLKDLKRKTDISLRLSENSCIFAKDIFRSMK